MTRLGGKVALITGGSVGIGAAIATLFAQEGAAVVVTGRRKDMIEDLVRGIQEQGGRALAVAGSVADENHVQSSVVQSVRTFGRLDILVNNAGIGAFGKRLHETDDTTWNQLLDTNLTGLFRMTRAAIPELLKSGGGSIVNISSIASRVGIPMTAAYSATKGAVDALTRAVAVEYAKDGIRCNAICPGLVKTPMASDLLDDPERRDQVMAAYPMGRPGTPDEIARLVLYLASDEASWTTGGIYPIDGGMTAQ